eukprot:5429291-Prorocentrum_lima.AAC.1
MNGQAAGAADVLEWHTLDAPPSEWLEWHEDSEPKCQAEVGSIATRVREVGVGAASDCQSCENMACGDGGL